jgi:hypothetical protein
MMHFNGYKYKEIADHLNIPIGTVKSRIYLGQAVTDVEPEGNARLSDSCSRSSPIISSKSTTCG